jgi:threonine dehydratase
VETTAVDVRKEVLAAEKRIRPFVMETPVEHSIYLSKLINGTVHLKMDLYQTTGSFKFRGATSKIMSLSDEELDKGILTASTGNYALALGQAMKNIGRKATIYLSKNVPESRVELIKSHGLNIVIYGNDPWDAEKKAREVAETEGKIYVSPYNDPEVVGGQGTCGLEIEKQVKDVDTVVIALGGGGLLGGIGGYLKTSNPDINIIGVSPKNSAIMAESVRQGKMIEMESLPTLADTCAGGVDSDTITFEMCQKYVDEIALITEEEIKEAIKILFEKHRLVSEGSAALPIAYLLKNKEKLEGKNVVLVVCGRNIGTDLFKSIINS